MTAKLPRIAISNWVHDEVIARLKAVGDVDANRRRVPWSARELIARSEHADALLAFMPDRIDATFLGRCRRLKVVACALKGFDNFDVEARTDAGVWVTIAPDLLTNPTAELAVGLAIALARHVREGDALMRSGAFKGWRPVFYGKGLDQSVVTIVGMGAVGRAIAARLAGFGCRILGVDLGRDMPDGVTAADFDAALAASDYLIVAVPLTAGTFHLIGREALKREARRAAGQYRARLGGRRDGGGGRARVRRARRLCRRRLRDGGLGAGEPAARCRSAAVVTSIDAVHAASRLGGRPRAP